MEEDSDMFDPKDLKETFDLHINEIKEDKQLLNEYIVDDMVEDFGYNKRRDPDVKRMRNSDLDWVIKNKFGIKLYTPGIFNEKNWVTPGIKQIVIDNNLAAVMITSGNMTDVFVYIADEDKFIKVCEIDLDKSTEITSDQDRVIRDISKDTFSKDDLVSVAKGLDVDPDKIKNAFFSIASSLLKSNRTALISGIRAVSGVDVQQDTIFELIDKISNSTDTADTSEMENEVQRLTAEVEEVTKQLEAEAIKSSEYTKKIEESDAKIVELQGKLEDTEEKFNSASEELSKVKAKYEELEKTASTTSEVDPETEKKLAEQTTKADELQGKVSSLEIEMSKLHDTISEIESAKTTLETENSDLKNKLDEAKKSGGAKVNVSGYVVQIEDLTNKLAEAQEENKNLKKQIEEDIKKINSMEGADERKARELLAEITDDPEAPRTYLAIIDTELINDPEIHRFVGHALMELYKIKRLEAQQYIFGGNIFRLVQPAERRDIIMDNHDYDFDFGDMNEDEILNKLRILFSHFPDIIFKCKKLGKAPSKEVKETSEVEGTSGAFQSGSDEQNEQIVDFGSSESESDSTNNNNKDDNSDDFGSSDNVKIEGFDDAESESSSSENKEDVDYDYLLVSSMSEIDNLIWLDHNEVRYKFITVKYIGNNDVSFAINREVKDISYEQLCCKMIDAVLAVAINEGFGDALSMLRRTDLSKVNSLIQPYNEENRRFPRINGTKYVVTELNDVPAAITVVHDICNTLGIREDDLWVYIYAVGQENQVFENFSFAEESIKLVNKPFYDGPDMPEHEGMAALKGDLLSSVSITKNSLKTNDQIMTGVAAIKSRYDLCEVKSMDDVNGFIQRELGIASDGGVNIANIRFGNVTGESKKILSTNESDVGENASVIRVGDNTFYMADMKPYQVLYGIMRIHKMLFGGSTEISVMMKVNLDALQYYINEFETSEPSTELAIRGFATFVSNKLYNSGK